MGADCKRPVAHLSTKMRQIVSVLPNDYNILLNVPTINGVELRGELRAVDIHLLSANADDYEAVEIEEARDAGHVLVMTGDGSFKKMTIRSLEPAASQIATNGSLGVVKGSDSITIDPDGSMRIADGAIPTQQISYNGVPLSKVVDEITETTHWGEMGENIAKQI